MHAPAADTSASSCSDRAACSTECRSRRGSFMQRARPRNQPGPGSRQPYESVIDSGARRPPLTALLPLVQALLEPVERTHRRQHLGDARVRLALLLDRGDELAVLQLDAVHRHGDARQIDLLVVAVEQIVVTRDVRALVADITEERALRAFV